MKVYVVNIHYDYEFHSIHGVYTSKSTAETIAQKLRQEDDTILDGVTVEEYELVD